MSVIRESVDLPRDQSFRLLRWHHNLHEVELVLAPNKSTLIKGEGEHWHFHEALELAYFEEGEGLRFVGDQIQSFHRGDLVLLGSNLPHYWHLDGRSSGWAIQWRWPATHHVWAFPEAEGLAAYFHAATRGIQYYGHTAGALADGIKRLASASGLDRLSQLLGLFALLTAAPDHDRQFISSKVFSVATDSRHQGAMQSAIRFLLENFREDIRLTEILKLTHMSRPTFSRQFKRHSGKTLNEFLQQIRLNAAGRDLAETDNAVIDVAFGNGFSQVSFFNRVFRRRFGCNPTAYRAWCRRKKA